MKLIYPFAVLVGTVYLTRAARIHPTSDYSSLLVFQRPGVPRIGIEGGYSWPPHPLSSGGLRSIVGQPSPVEKHIEKTPGQTAFL